MIELMHNPDQAQLLAQSEASQFHFAISLGGRNRVDALVASLASKNIEILKLPRITGDGYYEALVKDIEGNLIEITE